jgi:DNA-binding transcriptional LysR family regulator
LVAIGDVHLGILPYFENRAGLESIPIFQDEMLLLGPKNDPFLDMEEAGTVDMLLQQTFFVYYSDQPFRKITDKILLQLLGSMPEDIREVNDLVIMLKLISAGLGYTILPTSHIYDTMNIFNTLFSSSDLPNQLVHESVPYQIYRLGAKFPNRTIQMIFPTDTPYLQPIQNIARTLSFSGTLLA